MRIIFAGTAQFAVPTLKTLLEHHNVLAVITAPVSGAGRGRKVKQSPVKETVLEYCKGRGQEGIIPLFTQPINKLAKQLTQLKPDIIIVAAYGQLLSKEILAIPRLGCWNIHPSLLPKYRGASPIQAAILNGDSETGVTIIQMNEKLDAGPIITQEKLKLSGTETAGLLHDTLATKGASLLRRVLEKIDISSILGSTEENAQIKNSLLVSIPQYEGDATYTKKITARDAQLQMKEPAHLLERKVRAYNPTPGAYVIITHYQLLITNKPHRANQQTLRLKIWAAEIKKDADASLTMQTSFKNISLYQRCPTLICGDGKLLVLTEVQPEGKKRMSGEEFARGHLKEHLSKK